jgi:hypothetical protein
VESTGKINATGGGGSQYNRTRSVEVTSRVAGIPPTNRDLAMQIRATTCLRFVTVAGLLAACIGEIVRADVL